MGIVERIIKQNLFNNLEEIHKDSTEAGVSASSYDTNKSRTKKILDFLEISYILLYFILFL